MDNDRIVGTAKETFGKAEAAAGSFTGDHETELRGRVREAAGAAQDTFGQVKDDLSARVSDLGGSAEEVFKSIEHEVKARPLVALLIAALIGFVLAQLTLR
jgi:uncharacterized protein YjbJ (UPF0337 family)